MRNSEFLPALPTRSTSALLAHGVNRECTHGGHRAQTPGKKQQTARTFLLGMKSNSIYQVSALTGPEVGNCAVWPRARGGSAVDRCHHPALLDSVQDDAYESPARESTRILSAIMPNCRAGASTGKSSVATGSRVTVAVCYKDVVVKEAKTNRIRKPRMEHAINISEPITTGHGYCMQLWRQSM